MYAAWRRSSAAAWRHGGVKSVYQKNLPADIGCIVPDFQRYFEYIRRIAMKKAIYYFSGTGNSMRAAEKTAMRLGDTEIIFTRNNPTDIPATEIEMSDNKPIFCMKAYTMVLQ